MPESDLALVLLGMAIGASLTGAALWLARRSGGLAEFWRRLGARSAFPAPAETPAGAPRPASASRQQRVSPNRLP